jgi:hypothetical protein
VLQLSTGTNRHMCRYDEPDEGIYGTCAMQHVRMCKRGGLSLLHAVRATGRGEGVVERGGGRGVGGVPTFQGIRLVQAGGLHHMYVLHVCIVQAPEETVLGTHKVLVTACASSAASRSMMVCCCHRCCCCCRCRPAGLQASAKSVQRDSRAAGGKQRDRIRPTVRQVRQQGGSMYLSS